VRLNRNRVGRSVIGKRSENFAARVEGRIKRAIRIIAGNSERIGGDVDGISGDNNLAVRLYCGGSAKIVGGAETGQMLPLQREGLVKRARLGHSGQAENH